METQNVDKAIETILEIDSNDPKLSLDNRTLKISPFYWNYPFITSVLPIIILLPILIFANLTSLLYAIYLMLIICISSFVIWPHLRYCNTLYLDYDSGSLTIYPNHLLSFYKKKLKIDLSSITQINYSSLGFLQMDKRYLVCLITTDNKRIRLISSNDKKTIQKIGGLFQ